VRIGVFCGSRETPDDRYRTAAVELGRALAERRIDLVYGGSVKGLMGIVANAALQAGGSVIGVMPAFLVEREMVHPALTDLRIVESLSERKSLMLDLCDAFIVLPGGFGTLDEMFEVLTTAQVGLHAKPCVIVNIGQFFQHLIDFLDHAARQGFVLQRHRMLMLEAGTVGAAVDTVCTSVTNRQHERARN
jgi:uncharacterized protein (TIGR00730 family)